jgi:hypothetical protein
MNLSLNIPSFDPEILAVKFSTEKRLDLVGVLEVQDC